MARSTLAGSAHKERSISRKTICRILVLVFILVPSTLNLEHKQGPLPS